MSHTVFLDESGDLGFKFGVAGGSSSTYLTMGFIVVPDDKRHLLKRIVRRVYKKYGYAPGIEVKGSKINKIQKDYIANQLVDLIKRNPDISIHSMTVFKPKVTQSMQRDCNLLYNFMMKLCMLDKIDALPKVILLRDNKSVKVASGNSLIEYLQTVLTFEMNSITEIEDKPRDSEKYLCLMLTDWLSNMVYGHYEKKKSSSFLLLAPVLRSQTLFF